MKVDDRLVLQLFCHITRLDISACSEQVRELVQQLPDLAKNGFTKYRSDVAKVM